MWFGSPNTLEPLSHLFHVLPYEWTQKPQYVGLETYQMLDTEPLISESGVPYIKHYSIHTADGDTDPDLPYLEKPNNILRWQVKCPKVKARKV
jgi:hypothetical protein